MLRSGLLKKVHENFFVIENHLKFLLAEKVLKEDVNALIISLDDKGWAIMTDIENLGYVRIATKDRNNLIWKRSLQIIFGLSAIVGTLLLIYPCVDESSIDQSSTLHDQQQIITPSKTQPTTTLVDSHLLDTLSIVPEEKIDTNIEE